MATKYKLIKPIKFDGKTIKEVELNLDELTGTDIIQAEKSTRATGDSTPVIYFSSVFQSFILAKYLGVSQEVIASMHAKDFANLSMRVANFFV